VARDELLAAFASITAVLQTLLAAVSDPANEIRNSLKPDQHAESTCEAQIETQLGQEHGEATPDMHNDDYGLESSLLGSFSRPKTYIITCPNLHVV
jgi:hypothetical protein